MMKIRRSNLGRPRRRRRFLWLDLLALAALAWFLAVTPSLAQQDLDAKTIFLGATGSTRHITTGTTDPSGGANGDFYLKSDGTLFTKKAGTWVAVSTSTGTVTSAGLSVPTGFSVTGSPVTTSGTLALAFATGYSLPSDTTQSGWSAKMPGSYPGSGIVTSTGSAWGTSITDSSSNWNSAYTWTNTNGTNVTNHLASTSNPHSVTASQVSLGNVTNESKATMFSSPAFTGTVTMPTGLGGLLFATAGVVSTKVIGSDVQAQLSGTGFVKASGTSISYDNSTYLTGNQTVTLSGVVTGSGATSITTAFAAAPSFTAGGSQYAGTFTSTSGTDFSLGVLIKAGTSATDYALRVRNKADDADLFYVRGDGYLGGLLAPLPSKGATWDGYEWTWPITHTVRVWGGPSTQLIYSIDGTTANMTFGGYPGDTKATYYGTWAGQALGDTYISSASTWNAKQAGHANLTSLAALSYASTSFVKMTSAGTFTLDTATYSVSSHTHSGTYEPVISAGTTGQYWRGDKSWQTLDKSAVGLGSVENTALSTWAGSANVTTLGTITTAGNVALLNAANTFTAFGTHRWTASGTGLNGIVITQSTSGAANFARLGLVAGTSEGYLDVFSQGYTTSGADVASSTRLVGASAGGLGLAATDLSGDVRIYSRNALAATWGASGALTNVGTINGLSISAGTISGSAVWNAGAVTSSGQVRGTSFLMNAPGRPEMKLQSTSSGIMLSMYSAGKTTWAIETDQSVAGNFAIRRSTSVDGDPESAGVASFWIANNDAATFASTINSGAVTSSGLITSNATAKVFSAESGTTAALYQRMTNTGGDMFVGLERSAGAGIFIGAPAYATVLGSNNATSLVLATNTTARLTLDGTTGAATFTSTINSGAVTAKQPTNDSATVLTLLGYTTGADGARTVNVKAYSSDSNNWAKLALRADNYDFGTSAGMGKFTLSNAGAATFAAGVSVGGSQTGYGGGELKFSPTTAGAQNAITTFATGAPEMLFDHRATSNTGSWSWRNGSGAANTQMYLSGAGALTVAAGVSATTGTFQSYLTLGPDGTYGANYMTLSFTGGMTNGNTRIFSRYNVGDDLYLAAGTGRGVQIWTNGSSSTVAAFAASGLSTFYGNTVVGGTLNVYGASGPNRFVVQMPSATAYNTAGVWLRGMSNTDGMSIGGLDNSYKTIDTYGGGLYLNTVTQNGVTIGGTLTAGELLVSNLVARNVLSTIGGRVVTAPTTLLVADLSAGATTIHVKHAGVLANGDRIYMEKAGQVEWIAVASAASGSEPDVSYTITRGLDSGGTGHAWTNGDAVMDSGTTGGGYIDQYSQTALLSTLTTTGPTIVGMVRTGTTYSDLSPRWVVGRMDGYYSKTSTSCIGSVPCFGLGAGNPSGNYLIASQDGISLNNGTLSITTAGISIATTTSVGNYSRGYAFDATTKAMLWSTKDSSGSGTREIGLTASDDSYSTQRIKLYTYNGGSGTHGARLTVQDDNSSANSGIDITVDTASLPVTFSFRNSGATFPGLSSTTATFSSTLDAQGGVKFSGVQRFDWSGTSDRSDVTVAATTYLVLITATHASGNYVRGFTGGTQGRTLALCNRGAQKVYLSNQYAGVSNDWILTQGAYDPFEVNANSCATFVWDGAVVSGGAWMQVK